MDFREDSLLPADFFTASDRTAARTPIASLRLLTPPHAAAPRPIRPGSRETGKTATLFLCLPTTRCRL